MQKMLDQKRRTAESRVTTSAIDRLASDINEHEAAARRTGDDNEAYLADLCRARLLIASQRLQVAS